MHQFEVWAPFAKTLQLFLSRRGRNQPDEKVAMEPSPSGWWHVEVRAEHGDDYGYIIDGERPVPDPRSCWQPQGVHGLSRLLQHNRFAWSDQNWRPPLLSSGVIYEIHMGTFTPGATFISAIERLPHLVELGITHVEVMPVHEFSGKHGWGYDGVDLYAPHHVYGGPEHFKQFVDACHSLGLAVILDVVYNHLGPSGNYLERFGPYLTERYMTPWGKSINLDAEGSDTVRQFLIENAAMWFYDYHVDGLRLDAVHALIDQSATHFLEQLADQKEVWQRHLGRDLVLIAESDLNDPRVIKSRDVGGYGMEAQWSDDFHHALHRVVTGESAGYYADFHGLPDLAKALTQGFVFDGRFADSRGRRHGRPLLDIPADRLLGYIQNHDQIGNRAKGERLALLASPRLQRIAAALVMTAPFVPMLFQGEEWGTATPFLYFTDHEDQVLAEAVRNGRRSEFASFGWRAEEIPDPQALVTYHGSRLDWSELEQDEHAQMLHWYKQLLQLRRREPALTSGTFAQVEYDETARWLIAKRGNLTIVANFNTAIHSFSFATKNLDLLLVSDEATRLHAGKLDLPGEAIAVIRSAHGPMGAVR